MGDCSVSKETLLITGVAGFIGFHAAKRFLELGYLVIGIDNLNDYYDVTLKKNRLEVLIQFDKELNEEVSFQFHQINIEKEKDLNILFSKFHFSKVLHLAAQAGVRYSITNPQAYIDANSTGFLNILEFCRKNAIAHLVYASSSSVYGLNQKVPFSEEDQVNHPVSLYATTKRMNELMAHTYSHLYNLPTTGLRFFTVYGPWGRPDMAIYLFTRSIYENKPISVFNNGNMLRDFTFIDDIIDGITRITEIIPVESNEFSANKSSVPFALFNIGRGKPVGLMDFISEIEKSTGKKAILNFSPMQDGDVQRTFADLTNLKKVINYSPKIEVAQGVRSFVEWYKNYYRIKE